MFQGIMQESGIARWTSGVDDCDDETTFYLYEFAHYAREYTTQEGNRQFKHEEGVACTSGK